MKKLVTALVALALLVIPSVAMAGGPGEDGCTTIQDGVLTYSAGHYLEGQPLSVGYDAYGYNYQAHMFNGSYCNVYLGGYGFPPYEGDTEAYLAENPTVATVWCWPYRDVEMVMKWNDAWISNKDCDGDGKLDRYYGHPSYIGSGAWETNHQSGTYVGEDGKNHRWIYFVKIVAKPTADYDCAAHGGTEIWGSFCEIQSVYNDPYGGFNGLEYKATRPGLGNW
jgi:hypothetical protein